jgi:hypothetical protein
MSTRTKPSRPAAAWWRGLAARERTGLMTLAALVLLATSFGPWPWARRCNPWPRPGGTRPAGSPVPDHAAPGHRKPAVAGHAAAAARRGGGRLKAATERLGDKGRLMLQGERAVLTLNGAGTASAARLAGRGPLGRTRAAAGGQSHAHRCGLQRQPSWWPSERAHDALGRRGRAAWAASWRAWCLRRRAGWPGRCQAPAASVCCWPMHAAPSGRAVR